MRLLCPGLDAIDVVTVAAGVEERMSVGIVANDFHHELVLASEGHVGEQRVLGAHGVDRVVRAHELEQSGVGGVAEQLEVTRLLAVGKTVLVTGIVAQSAQVQQLIEEASAHEALLAHLLQIDVVGDARGHVHHAHAVVRERARLVAREHIESAKGLHDGQVLDEHVAPLHAFGHDEQRGGHGQRQRVGHKRDHGADHVLHRLVHVHLLRIDDAKEGEHPDEHDHGDDDRECDHDGDEPVELGVEYDLARVRVRREVGQLADARCVALEHADAATLAARHPRRLEGDVLRLVEVLVRALDRALELLALARQRRAVQYEVARLDQSHVGWHLSKQHCKQHSISLLI